MEANLTYYLAFSHFIGIGPVRFEALIKHFGNVEKAYKGDIHTIKHVIGSVLGEKFDQFRRQFDPVTKINELKKKEITVVTQENLWYPSLLRNIPDPPICLYVRGDLRYYDFSKDNCFGIVGTRKPTSYGQQVLS
jgi:DNA processing protein